MVLPPPPQVIYPEHKDQSRATPTCRLTLVRVLLMNPESGALLYMAYRIPEPASEFGRRGHI